MVKQLCDLLSEGSVLCPLEAEDKWGGIESCLRSLPQIAARTLDFDEALEAVKERESQEQGTILEGGVAIPHGILPDPAPLVCGLGISPKGIPYSPTGEKAQILFLILGSRSVRKDYLGVLAQIARLFRGPELKEKILAARSAEEVLTLIKEAERY